MPICSKAHRTAAIVILFLLAGAAAGNAQSTSSSPAPAAQPAAPAAPLSTFVLTGPLQWLPPAEFDAGPFGKLAVNGILTGYAQGQNNPMPGDDTKQATLSNGQIFIQKPDGKIQYFVEAGVYTMPTLGAPFLDAQDTVKRFYGPVPVAFLKLATGKTTSWEIGALPTLMGAESTFTYQNFNIDRGLLWAQENAVNRGLQVNQTLGKYLTASFSWNDGYYSDRYSWLSGSLTFTKGANTLVYDGMGNLSKTAFQTLATPVQNNSVMHAVIDTYTKGSWIASAYYQYSHVPTNPTVGVLKGATTNGFAVFLSKAFHHGFALPGRFEYIAQSGTAGGTSVNLLYGPGSSATSFTVTPTYQKGGFYFRSDLSYVHAMNFTTGDAFGPMNTHAGQFRAVGEFGFIFGDNLSKK
ncbi:MAG: outer membrane beta-barrel protein [Acidobacteriota bacterium]